MAVTYRTTTNTGAAYITTAGITLNKPASTADGDLLLVSIHMIADDITVVPSGWTLIRSTSGDAGIVKTYYKIAATEGASWTWTSSGTGAKAGIAVRIDKHDPVGYSHKDNGAAVTDGGTAFDIVNPVVPTITNCLLISFIGARTTGGNSIGTLSIANNNPSWTNVQAVVDSGAARSFEFYYGTYAAVGTTGNSHIANGFLPAGVDVIGHLIAVAPKYIDVTETVSLSEDVSVLRGRIANIIETVTLSDVVTTTLNQIKNAAKHVGTWFNQDKN